MATAITRTGDIFTIHGDGILIGITTMVITRTGDTAPDTDIIDPTGVTIVQIGEAPANRQQQLGMHLENNTQRIEMPDHTAPIQRHQEVPQHNPDQLATATNRAQTTIHRIITPTIHQEVIQEEVIPVHTEGVPQLVLAVEVAVTEDVLNVPIPDIENKFTESIFRI